MDLFTEEHIRQQEQYLYNVEDYSRGLLFLLEPIVDLINENGFSEILDYGAGLGLTAQMLDIQHEAQYYPYDPAIKEFSERPSPKEFVLAGNVLEYAQRHFIDQIIADLANLTKHTIFIAVNTHPIVAIPQTIQETNSWWLEKLIAPFEFNYFRRVGQGFVAIGEPRQISKGIKTTAHCESPETATTINIVQAS